MSKEYVDHFSAVAGDYADARPGYPPALFDWLASRCGRHEFAWDCGAGSGQASVALAAHFARVIATAVMEATMRVLSVHCQKRVAFSAS